MGLHKKVIEAKISWIQFDVHEWYAFRWVFIMLIVRDIKLRYKQTFLGIAWVILQPVFTAALFTVVFGHFLHLSNQETPYLLFAFCGLLPWMVFSQALQRATPSLTSDTRLITKVYFPRIFIPFSATFGVILDFCIALFLLIGLMSFYHVALTEKAFFLLVCILVLFCFSCGMNVFFSAVNVYYRDFKHIVPFLLQFWMYASPLVYSTNMIPEKYLFFYSLNPLVGIIDAFRWSLLAQGPFPVVSFSMASLLSCLLLFFGMILFHRIEHNFADYI